MSADRSESEVIATLSKLLTEVSKQAAAAEQTGACVYNAGGKTYCAEISKSACNQLSGIWTAGGKCP